MAVVVNTNPSSLAAQRFAGKSQKMLSRNLARLSSGFRINTAADDAAGMGISEKFRARIKGVSQALRNTNDGISLIQVAEGAMNEQAGILTRLRELAVQSANGVLTADDRTLITAEATQLVSELDRIATTAEFNGISVLAGTTVDIQVGTEAGEVITMAFSQTDTATLGTGGGGAALSTIDLSTSAATASAALDIIDASIQDLSLARSTAGAVQNRLDVTASQLAVEHENLSAANSRIRDVDVASETAEMTRNQILSQASVAVLAQANQLPQAALSLIGG